MSPVCLDADYDCRFTMSLAPGICPASIFYSAAEAFYAHRAMRAGDFATLTRLFRGEEVTGYGTHREWHNYRHEIMYAVLADKFGQNPAMRAELLDTGDAPIDVTFDDLTCFGLLHELLRTKLRQIDAGAFITVTWADDHLAQAVLKDIGRPHEG